MICVFFGHRDVREILLLEIKKTILTLVATKPISCFYVGNNGKFDYLVQIALQELRKEGMRVPYAIVLSRIDEKAIGGEQGATLFPEELAKAIPRFAIYKRNDWLMRRADIVVSYVNFEASNSNRLLCKAKKQGIDIINLA